MSYCTYQDVVDEFKNLDVTSGNMTAAKITSLIAQADAYINGRVGLIYVIPVTGPGSLLILKQISIGLTADRLANTLRMVSTTPEGIQLLNKDLIKQGRNDLDLIVTQDLNLYDAELLSIKGAVRSYTNENTVPRTFKKGVNQW